MYYAPHTLYVKRDSHEYDEYGNPLFTESSYKEVGACRCDDADVTEMADENGQLYRPSYKIVADAPVDVRYGDNVQVITQGVIRGEGRVRNISRCNYYKYVTIWI